MEVMIADMRSSEESDHENDNRMVVNPLLWRSALVDEFFDPLD